MYLSIHKNGHSYKDKSGIIESIIVQEVTKGRKVMSKRNQVIIAIIATLVILGISVINILSLTEINGIKVEGQKMLLPAAVASVVGVVFGALINKLFIWLSQLGQEEKQSVSFLTSWYATGVSQLPFAIVNIFLITVLGLYNRGNDIVTIVSGLIDTLFFVLILRSEKIITQRTQIIYTVIMVVLTLAIGLIPILLK